MKVLLVEDDQAIADLLEATLKANRCVMDLATDGEMGLEMLQQWEYDVILLDVMLPRLDGVSLCRQLRQQGCTTPILMLTAQADTDAVVTGLNAGADDYVTKPFDPPQLLARLRALQRRSTQEVTDSSLSWGALTIDPVLLRVTYHDAEIALGPKEYALLDLFLHNPQRIFSRGAILDQLWNAAEAPTEATVTNLIKDLRRRLKSAGLPDDPIETLHGRGYRLKSPPTQTESSPAVGTPSPTGPNDALQQVIKRFQQNLRSRLGDLERVEAAWQQNTLTPEVQETARATAHQLTGSLGSYGYGDGSDLMRTIEQLLTESVPLEGKAAERFSQLLARLKPILAQPPRFETLTAQASATQRVLVVDADVSFTSALEQTAEPWPLTLLTVPDLVTALHRLAQHSPDLLILNFGVTAAQPNTLRFLAEVTADFPQLPVIVLADQDRIENRAAVAPYGIRHFVVKPIADTELLALVTQVLATTGTTTATALVVDDDPLFLKTLSALLMPQGIQTSCLVDPSQFWQVLKTLNPTLLLLDLEMPNYNGFELCQTVRQDIQYRDLPILVITAHTDSISLQQAITAGADDVLPKPVSEDVLLARINHLLARRRPV
jgi:DNA-binding response OmpR family regulator/HPt (histidine-containing phosphotransfer) domain-containing protein